MNKKIDSTINENTINTDLEIIELDDAQLESAAGAGGDRNGGDTNGIGGLIGLCLDLENSVNIGSVACNEF